MDNKIVILTTRPELYRALISGDGDFTCIIVNTSIAQDGLKLDGIELTGVITDATARSGTWFRSFSIVAQARVRNV